METRKFVLHPDWGLERLLDMVHCSRDAVEGYIADCRRRIAEGRRYKVVGPHVSCDSLFDLEAMGLSSYSRQYQMLIDFSGSLDYLIHRITKCDAGSIRGMPDYGRVSKALLNCDFTGTDDINFGILFGLNPDLDRFFESISKNLRDEDAACGRDEFLQKIAYSFYVRVLQELSAVRDYTATALAKCLGGKNRFTYKSKSFSTAVVTGISPFSEELRLCQDGFDTAVLPVRCYDRYEYASMEVFICGSCRRCKNRI